MKNVINRALAAKKKKYTIPATEMIPFACATVLCTSGGPALTKYGNTSELGGGTIYGE